MNHTIYIQKDNAEQFKNLDAKSTLINDLLRKYFNTHPTASIPGSSAAKAVRGTCDHYKPNGHCLVLGCEG